MSSDIHIDLDEEEKKHRIGFWISLIGGIMLILAGIVGIIDFRSTLGYTLFYEIPWIFTLIWGILALVGCLMIYYGNEYGNILLFISSAFSIFGMFFPIAVFNINGVEYFYTISRTFSYIDPFLVLIGALINIAYELKLVKV